MSTPQIFNQFYLDLVNGKHDFSSHDYKAVLITQMPAIADAAPNYAKYTKAAIGGNYTGPVSINSVSALAAAKANVDFQVNPSWGYDANNPSTPVAILFYNDTDAGKIAVGFADITDDGGATPVDMKTENVEVNIHATGIFDVGKPA